MKIKKLFMILISSIIMISVVAMVAVVSFGIQAGTGFGGWIGKQLEEPTTQDPFLVGAAIDKQLLTVNPYSRPGDKLKEVNAIVIHYVGNPGTTAKQNRDYFEGLKDNHVTSASSHYIIGLKGEILQCVPLDEISYASNNRNKDTVAIECCHPDATGKFNEVTYNSLVTLTAALCRTYGLDPMTDVIRHYDVTGKLCPLYFVEHKDEWVAFKEKVKLEMGN